MNWDHITGKWITILVLAWGIYYLITSNTKPRIKPTIAMEEETPKIKDSVKWLIVWAVVLTLIGLLYYFGVLTYRDQTLWLQLNYLDLSYCY